MMSRDARLCIVVAVCVSACVPNGTIGDTEHYDRPVAGDLRLRLRAVRDIAVLNEPIVLAFSVENVTNHRLVAQMRMDASALRLVISTEGAPAVTTRSAFAE